MVLFLVFLFSIFLFWENGHIAQWPPFLELQVNDWESGSGTTPRFKKGGKSDVSDIFTSEDMENILRATQMYCHMDYMSGLFSSKTVLPI